MPLGSTIPIERKGRKQDWTEGQIEAEMLALVLTPLGATEIEKKKRLISEYSTLYQNSCVFIYLFQSVFKCNESFCEGG